MARIHSVLSAALGGLLLVVLGVRPVSPGLLFDTTDDRVTTASVVGAPTNYPISMAMVVYVPTYTTITPVLLQAGVITLNTGYMWYLDADHMVFWSTTGAASLVTTTGSIATNTWLFLGASSASATSHRFYAYNLSTRTVLFNETSTVNAGIISSGPTVSVKIFSYEKPQGSFTGPLFGGTVQWVGLYGADLGVQNGDAFLNLAWKGPFAAGVNPALLYTFTEMTGTTVSERMNTGNNGTLTNFPASPWQPMGLPGPVAW